MVQIFREAGFFDVRAHAAVGGGEMAIEMAGGRIKSGLLVFVDAEMPSGKTTESGRF